jgi:hypothetical protein
MKIHSMEAKLFYTDGQTGGWTGRQAGRQTDMTKLTVAFCNFNVTPKIALTKCQNTVMLFVSLHKYLVFLVPCKMEVVNLSLFCIMI